MVSVTSTIWMRWISIKLSLSPTGDLVGDSESAPPANRIREIIDLQLRSHCDAAATIA